MKIVFQKINGSAHPVDETSQERFGKISNKAEFIVDVRMSRNPQFHRKVMSLIRLVWENLPESYVFPDIESLLDEIKLKAGYYKTHTTTKQETLYFPKSISFEEMDEHDFREFFDRALDVIMKDFLPLTKKEIEQEIYEYIN